MSTTEQKIQQSEPSSTGTPTVTNDGGGEGVLDGLSMPSIKRTHLVVAGLAVALILAWYLYNRRDRGLASSDESDESDEQDGEMLPDREQPIEVEDSSKDPLKADESIVSTFVERGILTAPEA